mmetsp:Transcript_16242/g.63331  ORF Transcript_16242/g.63331 Transcript_16242/m.63331 type:complete len:475 (-) Transcript_16242:205-1629(-)|eukprot:CAMPEP_0114612634 /NCGR_PEP_ID=MMETSP0168-20121206/4721_1 /TAXON_ID=95228 ORGANISM="Vannella sp., Strain DIVA3 517/6/12" /NCGR_SAMPLE_ID=MMETSP0168 /ASSEMBLY_ACC=CAM_ASM_000044 /LENGTH=474 /DNA_ID=CAMNT_0001823621 /DNA_START=260 /DNA_END=1684 /DNA_ORIENTATION=-
MSTKISVTALGKPDKDGFLTKQGGSIKTWKKRWFVLKGDTMYYFKTPRDTEQTGEIKLESTCSCQPEKAKGKKYYFSVSTPSRTFQMFAESEETMKQWVDKISQAIDKIANPPASDTPAAAAPAAATPEPAAAPAATAAAEESPAAPAAEETAAPKEDSFTPTVEGELTIEKRIAQAKNCIPFLQEEDSKVLEFWQIWSESIPSKDDLQPGMEIEYHISTSANMQKLTWRTSGPQNIFIQKMVDFFWNVGAPESEIDRLNDVGALINPIKIGSWIDMSAKGGMDGGWYFPVDIPLKMAIEAADPGDPSKKVTEWAEKHSVEKSFSVGRDMGAAPPRQTEIRLRLKGPEFSKQLEIGMDAFEVFGFPPIPENALNILRKQPEDSGDLCMSVITSSEGFVRLGLLAPNPSKEVVEQLCGIAGAKGDDLAGLEKALGSSGPAFAEYQFLKEGFGYGVYKEGFDIVFHYVVGGESVKE